MGIAWLSWMTEFRDVCTAARLTAYLQCTLLTQIHESLKVIQHLYDLIKFVYYNLLVQNHTGIVNCI